MPTVVRQVVSNQSLSKFSKPPPMTYEASHRLVFKIAFLLAARHTLPTSFEPYTISTRGKATKLRLDGPSYVPRSFSVLQPRRGNKFNLFHKDPRRKPRSFPMGLESYAEPCYTILYSTLLYSTLLLLCYAMLCYTILYYTILCYAMLCYAILYYNGSVFR